MDPQILSIVDKRLQERFSPEEGSKIIALCKEMLSKLSLRGEDVLDFKSDFDKSFFRLNSFLDGAICAYLFDVLTEGEHGKEGTKEAVDRALALFDLFVDSTLAPNVPDCLPPYHPYVMCLRASCRFLEAINRPLSHVNPTLSLINDIFETIFRKVTGYCQMLTLGLYPDGFVAWRTLHESECIVSLLVRGGENVRQAYVRHIAYNNAYRNKEEFTTAELDATFLEIKEGMRRHGLKSKDMKKYIEYGWLYAHPLYREDDTGFKLNFRDGVEKLSGLSRYSKVYEGASEIAHSSSAFFYVNDAFCRDLSLAMVYQTYLRIAELFDEYMRVYFTLHPEQKERAASFLGDCKTLSVLLEEKVGTIKEMEDAEKED